MPDLKNINFVPYHLNLLNVCVEDLYDKYAFLLPDLHQITLFLPNAQSYKVAREVITNQAIKYGCDAIILPRLTTLRYWVLSKKTPEHSLLTQYARELILVDALKRHAELFTNSNPWNIANELLSFFDALTLNNIKSDELNSLFLKDEMYASTNSPLSQEASLVTLLYDAWKEQLEDEELIDPISFYAQASQNITTKDNDIFYCVGLDQLSASEYTLLVNLDLNNNLYFYVNANNHEQVTRPDRVFAHLYKLGNQKSTLSSPSAYSSFFDEVFSENNISIKERANSFILKCQESPVTSRLNVYKTALFEQHVKAIDVWIRNNLFNNKKNIGVVTADRKLARRLRAVLEHANVAVNDLGGWALSTTSTAVIIELWLEIIEKNYPSKELLAILKSPFLSISVNKEVHDTAIDYFEKNILLARNVSGGLKNIHDSINKNLESADIVDVEKLEYILGLLDKINNATGVLFKQKMKKKVPIHLFFKSILNSLKISGIYTLLRNDVAGLQIIQLFEQQYSNFSQVENVLNWHEWRRLLARILDQQNFKPSQTEAKITFCSIEQSRLQNFDALVIASIDQEHFPGSEKNYVFLNESIRSELKIPTWRDERAQKFYLFRCLLDSAPDILITVQTERNGEHTKICPWLEAIETFHFMAYDKNLSDPEHEALVENELTTIQLQQKMPLPTVPKRSAVILRKNLKPTSISISQYQLLMSCPYQFFAEVGLKLSKTMELHEELDKSDFGSLVHKSIYAFYTDVPSIPGPFKERVTVKNRDSAISLLTSISNHVFKQYLQRSFTDQLWLQRWLSLIPNFIDWEIDRQKEFTPFKHEASANSDITDSLSLRGRVDRIDKSETAYAIVDYKTGQTHTKKSIQSGEQVQLPSYALLTKDCAQVEFLSIGKNNTVKSEAVLKDDELEELIHAHHQRLFEISKNLDNNIPLRAFADDDTCKYCDYRGICRKDFWDE